MQSDLSHVLYGNGMKPERRVVQDEESLRLQEEANRKAAERRRKRDEGRKGKEEGFTLEQLFTGEADDAPLTGNQDGR